MGAPDVGRFSDGAHVFALRVFYEDTDAGGVVYYANYLRFAERGRTEMLRALGISQSGLAGAEGLFFVVRRCETDYLAPGRLDDALDVWTRVVRLSGTSLLLEQTVKRDEDVLVRILVTLVCVGPGLKPTRLPDVLRGALAPLTAPTQDAE